MRRLSDEQSAFDVSAALDNLRSHPAVDASKLGAIGFCMGGDVIWRLATIYPDLKAAAPFYGGNPPLDQVPNIWAAVLGVYGDLDTRVNAGIPALTEALQAAGVPHQINIYPNSQHAFHADHRAQYNAETGAQAWTDTLDWFSTHLGLHEPSM
jgi:carboxymethylenebutenolidase